jgi:hypothetical protein
MPQYSSEEIDFAIEQIKPKDEKTFNYHIAKGSDWRYLMKITNPDDPPENHIYDDTDMITGLRKVGGIFVNDQFIPLWNRTTGLLVMYGGYGSSKTTYAVTRALVKCMENKYYRCYYGRQKIKEANELHSNIITEIKRNGWEDKFKYSEEPTGVKKIICRANGNSFILFGCDDVASLKGWDNPTDIIIDEVNQISFEAFGMMLTRLRNPSNETQLTMMFNNCDVLPDHWLVKYIFGTDQSDSPEEKIILESLKVLNIIRHHSIYLDNHFQNHAKYKASLSLQAGGDAEKVEAYLEGKWGAKLNDQPHYKQFKYNKHVAQAQELDKFEYNPALPLEFSWDENVNPYLPVLIAQVYGNEVRFIDEIAAENPFNSLDWVCSEIMRRYPLHRAGINIYGDATSKKEDVKQEKNVNLFTLIEGYLAPMFPRTRVPESNPNNAVRQNFLNVIFGMSYGGITIKFHPRCKKAINDVQNCPESPKGGGLKDKSTSMVKGVRGVQVWGHFSDCMDYFICEYFKWAYIMFQNKQISNPPAGGGRVVKNDYNDERVLSTTNKKEIVEDERFAKKINS